MVRPQLREGEEEITKVLGWQPGKQRNGRSRPQQLLCEYVNHEGSTGKYWYDVPKGPLDDMFVEALRKKDLGQLDVYCNDSDIRSGISQLRSNGEAVLNTKVLKALCKEIG